MNADIPHTDAVLLARLKVGDQDAFYEIYDRYSLTLLNHAQKKLRQREEARDIVQGVFAMLWQKRATLGKVRNLSAFLYASVRNAVLNRFAHREVKDRYHRSMAEFQKVYPHDADHLIREKQLKEAIEQEIRGMPRRMQEVFELSRKEYLSHQEIAERLGISERTVASHITHALKILRDRFGVSVLFHLF